MLVLPHSPTVTTIILLDCERFRVSWVVQHIASLVMFHEHVVSVSSYHMQPDVLTWISSTSECCAVL